MLKRLRHYEGIQLTEPPRNRMGSDARGGIVPGTRTTGITRRAKSVRGSQFISDHVVFIVQSRWIPIRSYDRNNELWPGKSPVESWT